MAMGVASSPSRRRRGRSRRAPMAEINVTPLVDVMLVLTISIAETGAIYFDEEPVDEIALAARLENVPRDADGKAPLVTLRADRSLRYERVIAVMGELNHAGFNSISLVTNSSVSAP